MWSLSYLPKVRMDQNRIVILTRLIGTVLSADYLLSKSECKPSSTPSTVYKKHLIRNMHPAQFIMDTSTCQPVLSLCPIFSYLTNLLANSPGNKQTVARTGNHRGEKNRLRSTALGKSGNNISFSHKRERELHTLAAKKSKAACREREGILLFISRSFQRGTAIC